MEKDTILWYEGIVMKQKNYDRPAAVAYAEKWALSRNPAYYNFDPVGGDCTNFVSQCLYAGAGVMNFTPDTGWYYRSPSDRAAAWTGVKYLYRFLTRNHSVGPYAHEVSASQVLPGDIIQLGTASGEFYHSLFITQTEPTILICAHTFDARNVPLFQYAWGQIRFLHIEAVRTW